MKQLVFLLMATLGSLLLSAQQPFDCIQALEVCNNEDLVLDYPASVQGTIEEDILMDCDLEFPLGYEQGTVWLRYRFSEPGDFAFTIIPDDPDIDLDFVVFQPSGPNCQGLIARRCMFTGENVGQPNPDSCMGNTGLASFAIDTLEGPGCSEGDDNFLASLPVVAGEELYLMVLNFNGLDGYTVSHTGTATISCMPTNTVQPVTPKVVLFPNPVNDELHLRLPFGSKWKRGEMMILDFQGKTIWQQERISNQIPLSQIPAGIYTLHILLDEATPIIQRFVKS